MNMEKVDQSQNVLGLSWYDKNIYFFSNSIFRQLETNLSQDMYIYMFSIAFGEGMSTHHFHPLLALILKGHFPYILENSCKVSRGQISPLSANKSLHR